MKWIMKTEGYDIEFNKDGTPLNEMNYETVYKFENCDDMVKFFELHVKNIDIWMKYTIEIE